MDAYKMDGGKTREEQHKNGYELFWTNPGSNTTQKSSCTAPYLPSHKPSNEDQLDMLGTFGEIKTNLQAMFFYELLHIDRPVLAD